MPRYAHKAATSRESQSTRRSTPEPEGRAPPPVARGLSVARSSKPRPARRRLRPSRGAARRPGGRDAEEVAGSRGAAATRPRRATGLPSWNPPRPEPRAALRRRAVRLLSMRSRTRQRALCEGLWARLSEGAPLPRWSLPRGVHFVATKPDSAREATGSLSDTLPALSRC